MVALFCLRNRIILYEFKLGWKVGWGWGIVLSLRSDWDHAVYCWVWFYRMNRWVAGEISWVGWLMSDRSGNYTLLMLLVRVGWCWLDCLLLCEYLLLLLLELHLLLDSKLWRKLRLLLGGLWILLNWCHVWRLNPNLELLEISNTLIRTAITIQAEVESIVVAVTTVFYFLTVTLSTNYRWVRSISLVMKFSLLAEISDLLVILLFESFKIILELGRIIVSKILHKLLFEDSPLC